MKALKIALLCGAALTLAGCATYTAAPAGPYAGAKGTSVVLGQMWSDGSALTPKKVRMLTIDGVYLNRLYITEGLTPGDFIVRAPSKDKPTPTIRADMTVTERIEFVADTVAALGYQRVETARPRPAQYGGHGAARFDLTARTSEGLDVSGTALISEVEGKTYLILFLAPTEHYFAAGLPEVERIMASAKTV